MHKGQVVSFTLCLATHYSFRTEQSGIELEHEMVSEGTEEQFEGKYRKDTAKQPIVLLMNQH
jgi:hypothetical protein